MSSTATESPRVAPVLPAVTPGDLLARVRDARSLADAAEVEILWTAIEWAYAHPDPHAPAAPCLVGEHAYAAPPDDRSLSVDELVAAGGWYGVPVLAWDAAASFAAANGMATVAGRLLIRDALILSHRLPRVWERVTAGQVPAWRARRVAATVAGQPDDVAAYVDEHVAAVAEKVGVATLDKLLDEAMLRLHAEDRELEQLDALDARWVRLHEERMGHTGIAELEARGDWKDLADFDETLTAVAERLGEQGAPHAGTSLDVRRSIAMGVLADPAQALALLTGTTDAVRRPRKRAVLHLHLSERALAGCDPVARNASAGSGSGVPVLAEQVREWCGRTDTHLTVLPVVDPTELIAVDAYEIPERVRRQVLAHHTTCVFPYCERRADTGDLDHIEPWLDPGAGGPPGQTSTENLAPLCRHHHRLKTHAGWSYRRIEAATYAWTDPHDQRFVVSPDGTTDVTPSVS